MKLTDYDRMLEQHDWLYPFSDDQRTWRSGVEMEKKIKALSMLTDEHKVLFDAYVAHNFERMHGTTPPDPAVLQAIRLSVGIKC